MLEYTLDDAQEVLTKNIEAAKKNLGYVEHDLDFCSRSIYYCGSKYGTYLQLEVKRRQAAKTHIEIINLIRTRI